MADRRRPPVILQVLPGLQAGGVERGTIEIAAAIAARGGIALVASNGGRMAPLVERAGGRHVTLPLRTKNPFAIWRNAGRLARLIRSEGVDIVHARSRAPAWSAWLAARRTGAAFITTWHGVYGEDLPFKKRYNAIMARGERVIAISAFVRERVARDYGVDASRLRVVPRGADLVDFDPNAVRADRIAECARAWNVPAGSAVIMLAGRITPWKGHALLLEALAMLGRDVPDWVCVLVGAEQRGRGHGARLVAQARRLGIGQKLRFAGHVDDMPAAYGLADVVVVPSLKPEPFGRVVVEAQAMGKPVVVAAHGAAMETVQHGVSGYLFLPGDAASLAATLAHALTLDATDRGNLGHWARAGVAACYSTQAMQAAAIAVYDELLPGRPGAPAWRVSSS
ncbi:glycosyltransferase family 4 protein [Lichenicoccus sp.]|uniref:glycosyltransferase family 4 protein n=1 Tax=Lichenicoccus sp. TaxID=2781899 RepID=UPI003D1079E7